MLGNMGYTKICCLTDAEYFGEGMGYLTSFRMRVSVEKELCLQTVSNKNNFL